MEREGRVVVIGSTNTDMVVNVPRIPAPGETILGGSFLMVPGGKGANQALAAARLGARVTFIGCIGQDAFGRQSLSNLAKEGVDLSYCQEASDAPSGVALIAVDADGQNAIVVAPGANNLISPAVVDAALPAIRDAHVVVLQCEIPLETVKHAIETAHALGKIVVLNPAPACLLPATILSKVHVLTPNETEARAILGETVGAEVDEQQLAERLLQAGVTVVILTLGARGALAGHMVDGVPVFERIPPFRVRAVDATAAGDCFTGALACALAERLAVGQMGLHPLALAPALQFASAAAAISVTRPGAQPSIPRRDEVERFLAGQPGNGA